MYMYVFIYNVIIMCVLHMLNQLCLSILRWHSFNRNQPSDTCTEVSCKWRSIIFVIYTFLFLIVLLAPSPIQSADLDSLYAVPIENKHNQEYVSDINPCGCGSGM